MRKLKHSEVASVRLNLLAKQGGKCAICKQRCTPDKAVLDHCHTSGHIRSVLHRGCNALLGKIENNYKRYGIAEIELAGLAAGAYQYMRQHTVPQTEWLHPTFKTADEKRLARNAAARKRRAAAKETT